ncbi:MAG: hypothetical protein JF886_14025 [Candidatus Dormibacteraeota bacterium]|uniref:Cytochrome B6 n=1 Tax=Candidatus Aeolococcus gillhamiae TaxID=3127015 RepID=A0A934JZT3_9BACT|nr:hypothetical protein [Candidatus Dormibacteraeota bacterium]
MRRRARGPDPERFRTVRYDLLKELAVAMAVVTVVVVGLSVVLSSPDVKADTIQRWAQEDPVDFVTTATNELAGASLSAAYGPPYNTGTASIQSWWVLHPQEWLGVHQPVDSVNQFVLNPLKTASASDAALAAALTAFNGASSDKQTAWLTAYTTALGTATTDGTKVTVPAGDDGPVPMLMSGELMVAQSGGLDGLLLSSAGTFYQTDYTAPLLFMGDGAHLSGLAKDQHLLGNQWGVMNETGRYPGQAWLWLFQMWYQIPPYSTSANVDLLVVLTMGVLSLALVFLPFIPGLRSIPRWIPVHRLIWRRFYAEQRAGRT